MTGQVSQGAIPQTDPSASYFAYQRPIDAAISRVLKSGSYILGGEAAAFETAFAQFISVAHAVGCANGTDAIELALRACNIGAGDLVFTVSQTAVATVAAIERAGATAVLIDVEPETYTMSPHELLRTLKSPLPGRPAAVVPVHLYGQSADLSPICDVARVYDLRIIEDCAQSHGALYRGRATGSFGDIGCFSFYPTKNLGAFGDAGMAVTSDPGLASAMREIREYGWRERHVSARIGINSRLDPIQAAILGAKLGNLAADNGRRQTIAGRYDAGLAGLPLALPMRRPDVVHVFHQYVIRLAERDALRDYLNAHGIRTGIHYPIPVHLQPAYRNRVASGASGLGISERSARQILSLPMYPQLSDEMIDRVVGGVRAFFS
jgi:dTDP-4-amino-4,6-dideoxygalactose transaminase